MARLLKPDGTITPIEPINGTDFSLDELYKLIGCEMVQICSSRNGKTIIFDEEFNCRGDVANHPTLGICLVETDENGKETYKPYLNKLATMSMHPDMGPFVHNVICGNAVVCENGEFR